MLVDDRVLDVEVVPDRELVHARHDQLDALASVVNPQTTGRHAVLVGPSGTGKTTIAWLILRDLGTEYPAMSTCYINCWDHHSEGDVLYQLAAGVVNLPPPDVISRQGRPHAEPRSYVAEADTVHYVVVLDEVDQLDSDASLSTLDQMVHVVPVLITTHDDLYGALDGRIASRFCGGRHIQFDPYSVADLQRILRKRADVGLRPKVAPDNVLDRIADRTAGDARVTIHLLCESALFASERGHRRIQVEDVADAEPLAREELRQKALSNLTQHQRAIYEVLAETDGVLAMGEWYSEQVEDPQVRRSVRRHLQKLEHYNLVETAGANRGRQYQAL